MPFDLPCKRKCNLWLLDDHRECFPPLGLLCLPVSSVSVIDGGFKWVCRLSLQKKSLFKVYKVRELTHGQSVENVLLCSVCAALKVSIISFI